VYHVFGQEAIPQGCTGLTKKSGFLQKFLPLRTIKNVKKEFILEKNVDFLLDNTIFWV